MIRDDRQLAIDDVHAACLRAADRYSDMARYLAEGEREVFGRLATERLGWAQDLADAVRREGRMPDAPDADRVAMDDVAARARVALTGNVTGTVVQQAIELERAMMDTAAGALDCPGLDRRERALISVIRERAGAAIKLLETL